VPSTGRPKHHDDEEREHEQDGYGGRLVSGDFDRSALRREAESHESVVVTDLGAVPTDGDDGAVWNLPHGGDLDANLVHLGPAGIIGEHRNDEVDVLVYVLSGSGELIVDDQPFPLSGEHLALIPQGRRRSFRAGGRGLVYLSIHRRRAGLTLRSRPAGMTS
jgi:quercetin dioxygenase-like cupin family protein